MLGDLHSRRARIVGTEQGEDGYQIVIAYAPTSELTRYAVDLRALTGGRGSFTVATTTTTSCPSTSWRRSHAAALRRRGHASVSFCHATCSVSGITRVPAMVVMKLVSPDQRGSTCRWTWEGMPAPGGSTQVGPHIQPVRVIGPLDGRHGVLCRRPYFGRLLIRQVAQRSDMAQRQHQHVSAGIRDRRSGRRTTTHHATPRDCPTTAGHSRRAGRRHTMSHRRQPAGPLPFRRFLDVLMAPAGPKILQAHESAFIRPGLWAASSGEPCRGTSATTSSTNFVRSTPRRGFSLDERD